MELLKESGTGNVTGQDAMLFMLLDRLERLEQEARQGPEQQAALRAELSAASTDIALLRTTVDAQGKQMSTDDMLRYGLHQQVYDLHRNVDWLKYRVPRTDSVAFSVFTGVIVLTSLCIMVNTVMDVHRVLTK